MRSAVIIAWYSRCRVSLRFTVATTAVLPDILFVDNLERRRSNDRRRLQGSSCIGDASVVPFFPITGAILSLLARGQHLSSIVSESTGFWRSRGKPASPFVLAWCSEILLQRRREIMTELWDVLRLALYRDYRSLQERQREYGSIDTHFQDDESLCAKGTRMALHILRVWKRFTRYFVVKLSNKSFYPNAS